MVAEVHAIDGVSVEHVRPTEGDHTDGGLMALVLAAELAETATDDRLAALVSGVTRLTDAAWAMLVADGAVVASGGDVPDAEWVTALLAGSRHLGDPHSTSSDIFWADLPISGMWIAAGRDGRQVHERERVRLDLFARIADALLG